MAIRIRPIRDASTGLTPRESQVIEVLMQGLPRKLVAVQLGITLRTLDTHIRHVYDKLRIHTLGELNLWYRNRSNKYD